MPNHVRNRVILKNIVEYSVFSTDENGKKCFDFNKIIPMPDDIYQGDLGPEDFKKYGKNNWYDWRIDNWGTKWNAYDTEIVNNNDIIFTTAWECPAPVLKELSRKYPGKIIEHWWACEFCENTGFATYRDDVAELVCYGQDSEEALAAYEYCWKEKFREE